MGCLVNSLKKEHLCQKSSPDNVEEVFRNNTSADIKID